MSARRLAVPLLLLAACVGGGAPSAPVEEDDLAEADRAAYEATIARLESEIRAALDREAALRGELEDLRFETGDIRTCSERLAAAEVELAQCRDTASPRPAAAQPPSPSESPPSPSRAAQAAPTQVYGSVWSSQPTVSFQDPGITVTGRLISTRARREEVRVTITLLEDNRLIDSVVKTVPVGARATVGYHHQFPRRANSEHIYTATAEADY